MIPRRTRKLLTGIELAKKRNAAAEAAFHRAEVRDAIRLGLFTPTKGEDNAAR